MIVHNISDRKNTKGLPRAITVGGTVIRPGKASDIPDSALTKKVRALHGTTLWIGRTLPLLLRRRSRGAGSVAAPMTHLECRTYLRALSRDDLVMLCGQVSPAVPAGEKRTSELLVRALTRALFSGAEASPESFFWLRRWKRQGADYEERG
jgi:hypothetical protein